MHQNYENLFEFRPEAQIKLYAHFVKPDTMTQERIISNDATAARTINNCMAIIEVLKAYRIDMAQRYNALAVMPYALHLKLQRRKYDRVTFALTITRVYEDGTSVSELSENYTGKQRREAINRYHKLKKERPGIIAELAIEKSPHER